MRLLGVMYSVLYARGHCPACILLIILRIIMPGLQYLLIEMIIDITSQRQLSSNL